MREKSKGAFAIPNGRLKHPFPVLRDKSSLILFAGRCWYLMMSVLNVAYGYYIACSSDRVKMAPKIRHGP